MDAPRTLPEGTCSICDQHFTKNDMAEHLQKHLSVRATLAEETAGRLQTERIFHIVAEGRWLPEYWLHLQIRANAKLHRLDDFLRDIWLECCGHLSKFTIAGVEYVSYDPRIDPFPGEENLRTMNARLSQVLQPGLTFLHEYDFGTTTELSLRVLSERAGVSSRKSLQLLARNEPLDWRCAVCGKPATVVCSMCIYTERAAWYCDDPDCQAEHRCVDDGEYWLPVTNSPRVGMCGYTGFVDWGEQDKTQQI
jgi:hypothetical protein